MFIHHHSYKDISCYHTLFGLAYPHIIYCLTHSTPQCVINLLANIYNYMLVRTLLLLLAVVLGSQAGLREDGLCEGNKFVYLSTYVLGLQTDLKLAFADLTKAIKIDEVFYQEEIYRSYRIFNITQKITYNEGKQTAKLAQKNVLRVTGGTVRIEFNFSWTKTQLGQSLNGTGSGTVTSDIITYEKTLQTNLTHELQWHLTYSEPLAITNGFALNTIDPYRAADYQIISNMLNKLKNNQTTVKDNFLKAINAQLQSRLAGKVLEDQTMKFEKTIYYSYSDYRSGIFQIFYNQTLMNSTLAQDGLYLLFSQTIIGDADFECGDPVPTEPNDPKAFGGMQEFYSNSLLKSSLRYALHQKALDVNLTEEFWQSRAFQFFVGDLHDVMPLATKHMDTMLPITGICKALDDPVFALTMKTSKTYQAKVNFGCNFQFNKTHLISINLVVAYQITPKLTSKTLDIQLTNIAGTPAFIETPPFNIEYQQLAEFMVSETLALAKSGYVYGTGYKMKYPRKSPSTMVTKSYLILYDASAVPRGSTH